MYILWVNVFYTNHRVLFSMAFRNYVYFNFWKALLCENLMKLEEKASEWVLIRIRGYVWINKKKTFFLQGKWLKFCQKKQNILKGFCFEDFYFAKDFF